MKKQPLVIECPSCTNEERIDIKFDSLPFSEYDWFPVCSQCKVIIHIKLYIQLFNGVNKNV